jgi:CBS domain-containing protein
MEARDIMTAKVVTVGPDTPVKQIARTLLENGVSAVPVVDANQRVVGIVSEGDLMRRADIGTDRQRSWWLKTFAAQSDLAQEYVKSRGTKASEVMTDKVVTITATTPVSKIAEILEKNRIKRVPVTRRRKIVGIVSRANLLHGLTTQPQGTLKPPRKSDREIRERIMDVLAREPWAEPTTLNVMVQKGHVDVWGFVDSKEQERALRVAIETVRGVKSIKIHAGRKRYAYI